MTATAVALMNTLITQMTNAIDTCQSDGNKLVPGACGCGRPDPPDYDPGDLGLDSDGDGFNNACDTCPQVPNPGQEDTDGDWEGDACEGDIDGDGVPNASDNCPMNSNPDQADSDNDGVGDACDACPHTIPGIVVDGSGCPLTAAPADFDRDGDVDMEDFGRFQACLTGPYVPQNDPNCANARLDGDTDVDQADMTRFLHCLTGPAIPANPNCAN